MLNIVATRHPQYAKCVEDWTKWRLTYEGGKRFINTYLKEYSKRETPDEFQKRKEMTYCPRFAGSAIEEVKNNIAHRLCDVTRHSNDKNYLAAINGKNGGVDLNDSTMDYYVSEHILPELLTMSRVGVYVDMPDDIGETLIDNINKRPYVYLYYAEDIVCWNGSYVDNCYTYTSLLLKDMSDNIDAETNLVTGQYKQYKHFLLTREGVLVSFYDTKGKKRKEQLLQGLTKIPFVLFELPRSLLQDVADYQIALLNIESSDINYITKSNFPFYVEPYDPRTESGFFRQETDDPTKRKEVVNGPSGGRRYPKESNAPEFIHPSPEPLMASITKQRQIKDDIRTLLSLNLASLDSQYASAESKGMDDRAMEAGLAAIAKVLQKGEQQIANFWAQYTNIEPPTITYPKNYNLLTVYDRLNQAKTYAEMMTVVPSVTCQKEIAIKISETLVSSSVGPDVLERIKDEILAAEYMSSNPTDIGLDLEHGLVSTVTASKARGYADGEVEQAKKDHAERIARIQQSQSGAGGKLTNPKDRGVTDLNSGSN